MAHSDPKATAGAPSESLLRIIVTLVASSNGESKEIESYSVRASADVHTFASTVSTKISSGSTRATGVLVFCYLLEFGDGREMWITFGADDQDGYEAAIADLSRKTAQTPQIRVSLVPTEIKRARSLDGVTNETPPTRRKTMISPQSSIHSPEMTTTGIVTPDPTSGSSAVPSDKNSSPAGVDMMSGGSASSSTASPVSLVK